MTVAGGVPVFSADGRERIGAVGVSGEAPADDAACAEAGIAAAGLRSRAPPVDRTRSSPPIALRDPGSGR